MLPNALPPVLHALQQFPALPFRSQLDFGTLVLHFAAIARLFDVEAERLSLVADFLDLIDSSDFGERFRQPRSGMVS